jgi:hypothetical protein
MENSNLDLWPESFEVDIKINPPLMILREQASLLEKKTSGLVKAIVQKGENDIVLEAALLASPFSPKPVNSSIRYSFWLVAPAFGNYKYQLFTVVQPVEMYPLRIVGGPLEDMEITSEEDLIEKLKLIFASEKVQRVIGAMIAQSQAA